MCSARRAGSYRIGMSTPLFSPSLRPLRALSALALALLAACGGTVDLNEGAGSTGGGTGSGSGGAGGAGPGASPASVRVAHLFPDLGAFDLCAGTEAAPALAARGLQGGLGFTQVSGYLSAAPSGAAWRLVPPGLGCDSPEALPLSFTWPAGAEIEGARVTLVPFQITGGNSKEVVTFAYLDQPINDQYGINLRVLDFLTNPDNPQAPTVTVDVLERSVGEQAPSPLFWSLAFGTLPEASPMGEVSAAGYVHKPQIELGELHIVPAWVGVPLVTAGGVPIPPGEGNAYGVGSVFVAGRALDGSARVVVCVDDLPAEEALSGCTVLTPTPMK